MAFSSADLVVVVAAVTLLVAAMGAEAETRRYQFDVQMSRATRLCSTKRIVTVNGQYPGPTLLAREGDDVEVTVANHSPHNVSIHWHGVRQLQTGWADGPAYVTQCPIMPGKRYVYRFTLAGQRGKLWWHAHASWLRATVHGAIVILPPPGVPYPFFPAAPPPHEEVVPVLSEWWKGDVEAAIAEALRTGGASSDLFSDAFTINGLPGPLYDSYYDCNCSAAEEEATFRMRVRPGKTYMLRLINAALDDELFFSVANHTLTVVEVDAVYVKPFTVDKLVIAPGQTTNLLLTAKLPSSSHPGKARYYMAASAYTNTHFEGSYDNTTVAGVLEYDNDPLCPADAANNKILLPVFAPDLPQVNDTRFVANFTAKLRSLASPAAVPRRVDRRFFFTVGLGTHPCAINGTCQGPNGSRWAASINNVSFVLPATTALLQAHYSGKSDGVYSTDFPVVKPVFNHTTTNKTHVMDGTKLVVLPFGTTVELVMQDTGVFGTESHPMHLHGFNFYVVGQGFGSFDPANHPAKFNLVDPVERNTVGVPAGGWVAIRFRADNPGVWFMHCHLELHMTWGLRMAWLVLDGSQPDQKLPPPPSDLPQC